MKSGAAALAASPLLSAFANAGLFAEETAKNNALVWGILLHLGHNMWGDRPGTYMGAVDHLTFEEDLWDKLTEKASELGLNMVVIDLGEGIQYKSHPEIAIKGAWSVEKLRGDLDRLRKLGLEPIPKLNFSSSHDLWLGQYSRMVSTPTYYQVCSDLVKEVVEIFDHPRFFHLGYDEEAYIHQDIMDLEYVLIRKGELWKHDFLFFVDQCEKLDVRPWIWADYAWDHKDFLEWAPKSIVMSNWYYDAEFDLKTLDKDRANYVQAFLDLDKAGYDQIPTGSNWSCDENFGNLVKFCRENLSSERLLGYLQTNWHFEHKDPEQHLYNSIKLAGDAMY
jgi:hypothetical protein